ncbi:TetR/AcrR family transcriptional regulator [Chloroflexia bacterium SDU3-3]|nr:TetR/AcrR family transcriptional regulator [Chloroflexia bacterium SDU3-3]
MGHREDLLEGAKRCLYEKGYARTTARDIVAASGTNLASIGYHYGSTEALLNAAMIQACDEWGEEMARALTASGDPEATPLEQFEAGWSRVIESLAAHRQLWVATLEATVQSEHAPELRTFMASALQQGREGLAALFSKIDPVSDPQQAWMVGSLYQALMSGVMVQWMIDPEHAPSGRDLAEAMRVIMGSGQPGEAKRD